MKRSRLRDLLGAGLVFLASALPITSYSQNTCNEARQVISSFPDSLPNGVKVKKYIVDGAKSCLVHVKQLHNADRYRTPEEEQFMLQSQSEIYNTLTNLSTIIPITEIYCEGHIQNSGFFAFDSERKELLKMEGSPEELAKERYPWASFARLAITHNVKVAGAETASGYKDAQEIMEGRKSASAREFNLKVLQNREDIAIDLASKSENPFKIVLYGAGHSFGGRESCGKGYEFPTPTTREDRILASLDIDNLYKWNTAHPDNKFSLIVLTTPAVTDFERYEREKEVASTK